MFPSPTPDANVVRYRVLFRAPQPSLASTNEGACSPNNVDTDRGFAESRRAVYAAFLANKVGDFIWHKHAMHLRLSPSPPCMALRTYSLEGETSVGDAIDDEWVVTWLLFQLTTQFPEDDALVQVSDTDGEFLLIECADVLPEWVSPENSADRVFVRRGELHLVGVDVVPEGTAERIQELHALIGTTTTRKASTSHAKRVFDQSVRAVYDDHVATRANAAMQRVLQQKLSEAPRYMHANRHRVRCQLPSKAAHVLTACPQIVGAAVEAFYYREPRNATAVCSQMNTFAPVAITRTTVTMSRCQYAQLKQQRFFPPKPFLHLAGVDKMTLNENDRQQTPDERTAEIGVKLACGLELLYAADEFDQFGTPWRQIIDDAVARFDESAQGSVESEEEDDDAWLYVHPDSLEEKLRSVAMRESPGDGEDDVVGGAEELQNLATMFNNFMGGVSGVDGVESSEPVQLDMSAFMKLLHGDMDRGSVANVLDDEAWDDPEDEDDYDDEVDEDSSIDSDDELENEPEDEEERIMREAMAEMDAELTGSTLDKTFTRITDTVSADASVTRRDDADEDKPLDLDYNLLSNLLESMASQDGLAGPVSNILSELTSMPR